MVFPLDNSTGLLPCQKNTHEMCFVYVFCFVRKWNSFLQRDASNYSHYDMSSMLHERQYKRMQQSHHTHHTKYAGHSL